MAARLSSMSASVRESCASILGSPPNMDEEALGTALDDRAREGEGGALSPPKPAPDLAPDLPVSRPMSPDEEDALEGRISPSLPRVSSGLL